MKDNSLYRNNKNSKTTDFHGNIVGSFKNDRYRLYNHYLQKKQYAYHNDEIWYNDIRYDALNDDGAKIMGIDKKIYKIDSEYAFDLFKD